MKIRSLIAAACLVLTTLTVAAARAGDCPQWCGSPSRNNVSEEKNLPAEWKVGDFDEKTGQWLRDSAKNVRWAARLGSQTYGTPVVAGGRVFCATNNGAAYLARYPATMDLGCLLAFGEKDGRFDWQLSCEKLAAGRALDWPQQGVCSAPLVEGKRLWIVTNRCEVVCAETDGNEADRVMAKQDALTLTLSRREREAAVLWRFDMLKQLGVQPHNMSSCSVTAAGDLLLVNTSNGVDESHDKIPSPQAASFIALDKTTGKLVWADSSPGAYILHGQWASPAYGVIGGVHQAVFAGGDGWVYGFLAKPTSTGKPELLWKFDCNPKKSVWKEGGQGDRGTLVATPVICDDRVYIATGEDPEYGEAPGHLWCIDATKRGDVSPELVFDPTGKPAPRRRTQAADERVGDAVKPNPGSAVVWHYTGFDANGDGKFDFKETMHRTLSMPAIRGDLLMIADLAGLVHCLDVKTGKVHWTYDAMSAIWGSPLVVDGKVYLGDEDGDVLVFEHAPKLNLLAKNNMRAAVCSSCVAANNTLFVATRTHLVAIGAEGKNP